MGIGRNTVRAMLFGHAIGDALGVPVEFQTREELSRNPVAEMRGFGSYDVPAGAWSDDTSMTLCLMESLARLSAVDYDDIMRNFVRWMDEAEFTPTGVMFDIGRATMQALMKFVHGTEPLLCGGRSGYDNGNGSLMRISPMAPYLYSKKGTMLSEADMRLIHEVSMLTHAHARSQMACGIYCLIALRLLDGMALTDAIDKGLRCAKDFYGAQSGFQREMETYGRLWDVDAFRALPETSIKSSGYVLDTLEAALWCLLNTTGYKECVLNAVNLGEDTDTVAAIAGGLAGLSYGWEAIPQEWKDGLLRADLMDDLCRKFAEAMDGESSCR